MAGWTPQGGGLGFMPEPVLAVLDEATRLYADPDTLDTLLSSLLPDLNPDEPDFEGLRKWCLALMERSGMSSELSEALVELAKDHAYRAR